MNRRENRQSGTARRRADMIVALARSRRDAPTAMTGAQLFALWGSHRQRTSRRLGGGGRRGA